MVEKCERCSTPVQLYSYNLTVTIFTGQPIPTDPGKDWFETSSSTDPTTNSMSITLTKHTPERCRNARARQALGATQAANDTPVVP